ncbi:hypothetical protein C8R44DRAFT_742727 [Mycena epipterygia]|nr:hypothetical protein C8R44DRAFT_742727 [Mycena epipterygia]
MPRVHLRVIWIRSHGYLHGKMKNSDLYEFIPTDDLDPRVYFPWVFPQINLHGPAGMKAQILKPGSVAYPWEQVTWTCGMPYICLEKSLIYAVCAALLTVEVTPCYMNLFGSPQVSHPSEQFYTPDKYVESVSTKYVRKDEASTR